MAGIKREVEEETGLPLWDLRLVGLYHGTDDSLLRITFAAVADRSAPAGPIDTCEILDVGWFHQEQLPRPMPVLALRMIADSVSRRRPVLAEVLGDSELAR